MTRFGDSPLVFFKRANNKVFRILSGFLLPPLERLLYKPSNRVESQRPIFFLGAPRSGTTLAMQVITDVFDLGYISNLHGKYYGAPALAEKLIRPTNGRPRSSYQSVHGVTDAPYAPSECSEWWYRFFRRYPRYVDLGGVKKNKMLAFRRSVRAMLQACGKCVLFKNPHAALRIQPIVKYLPESLFIVMTRNELDNAHSLLEVRKKVHNDYNAWWSMEPPEIDRLRALPPHEQVVEQIRHIHSTIEKDLRLSAVDPAKCFYLSYEDLCQDPQKEMERLAEFFKSNNCVVNKKAQPPEPFLRRKEIRIDRDIFEKVKEYVQER